MSALSRLENHTGDKKVAKQRAQLCLSAVRARVVKDAGFDCLLSGEEWRRAEEGKTGGPEEE